MSRKIILCRFQNEERREKLFDQYNMTRLTTKEEKYYKNPIREGFKNSSSID